MKKVFFFFFFFIFIFFYFFKIYLFIIFFFFQLLISLSLQQMKKMGEPTKELNAQIVKGLLAQKKREKKFKIFPGYNYY